MQALIRAFGERKIGLLDNGSVFYKPFSLTRNLAAAVKARAATRSEETHPDACSFAASCGLTIFAMTTRELGERARPLERNRTDARRSQAATEGFLEFSHRRLARRPAISASGTSCRLSSHFPTEVPQFSAGDTRGQFRTWRCICWARLAGRRTLPV